MVQGSHRRGRLLVHLRPAVDFGFYKLAARERRVATLLGRRQPATPVGAADSERCRRSVAEKSALGHTRMPAPMPWLVRNAVSIAAWVGKGKLVIRGVPMQPRERG